MILQTLFYICLSIIICLLVIMLIYLILSVCSMQYAINNDIFCSQYQCNQTTQKDLDFKKHLFMAYSPLNSLHCLYLIDYAYQNIAVEGFTLLTSLYASSKTVPIGSIYEFENKIVIVFRGTMNLEEALVDKKTEQTKYKSGFAHKGFVEIYSIIKPEIDALNFKKKEILITGHSLGGALSLLTSFDLMMDNQVLIYVYGCPKVFDISLAKEYQDSQKTNHHRLYRIENSCDIVPFFPLPVTYESWTPKKLFYYVPVGKLFQFTDNRKSYQENHSIYTYIANVKRLCMN